MTDSMPRLGRADLHIIAITDHERIDAAVAAQAIARDRGLRAEVIVGEEVTTLGGHLLGLYLDRPVWPSRPIPSCHTRSVPRAGFCAGSSTTRIRRPGRTVSRRSTRPASASRGI